MIQYAYKPETFCSGRAILQPSMKPPANDSGTRPSSVTQLLKDWSDGDAAARDRLMAAVYDELRLVARRHMRSERPGHTLQTTGLVNEAYLRLVDQDTSWRNRAHFFAIAAQIMRRILVDHARARKSHKRGGDRVRVTLGEAVGLIRERPVDLVALDQAMTRLAEFDPRQSQIVELRFFGGLTIRETAKVIGVSHTVVEREWSLARAWLRREISK